MSAPYPPGPYIPGEGHNLQDEEWEITRSDGEKRILRISTSLLETDDNVVHVLALMYDQTERVRASEDLEEIQARYRQIVEYTDNGVAVYRSIKDGEDFIFVDFKVCLNILISFS